MFGFCIEELKQGNKRFYERLIEKYAGEIESICKVQEVLIDDYDNYEGYLKVVVKAYRRKPHIKSIRRRMRRCKTDYVDLEHYGRHYKSKFEEMRAYLSD